MMEAKKLFIKTYGCQMNVYDSVRMQDLMLPLGYKVTDKVEESDMVVLNTCHIREKAAEKTYSELGRIRQFKDQKAKQGNPMVIVVAGCVGQAEGEEIFARAPFVDIVVGPQSYHSLPELVGKIERGHRKAIELDFVEEEKFDKLPEEVSAQGPSAFVSVQEGCDKFCTFCVVPYTRGAEFSRPVEQVYREVLRAAQGGAREITLLGQNVNAYHGTLPDGAECDLARLIDKIAMIDSVERIRYTTSHPRDMNDELIAAHGNIDKLMPFLHLPVQAGSNKVLKLMNRKHTREDYFRIVDKLRDVRPDIALSSDFIVGFPGETDSDFEETMDLVRKVGFSQCYSFKYSPRPGTPASVKEQVPEDVKKARLTELQAELMRQQMEFNKSCVGQVVPVLFDRAGKFDDQIIGKTPYMQSLYISGDMDKLYGKTIQVKVEKAFQASLTGSIV